MLSSRTIIASILRVQEKRKVFHTVFARRFSSNEEDEWHNRDKRLPKLMNLPIRPYPKLKLMLRNFIFSNVIIGPYYDKNFSRNNFTEGAKIAVEFVSNAIATGDFDTLRESKSVTEDCLREVILNFSTFSIAQQQLLAFSKKDLIYNFIYEIGVMLDSEKDTRHVEITYTAHYLPHLESLAERAESYADIKEATTKGTGPIILTYRFIRNYTKGVEDSWTINGLNHACLKEL